MARLVAALSLLAAACGPLKVPARGAADAGDSRGNGLDGAADAGGTTAVAAPSDAGNGRGNDAGMATGEADGGDVAADDAGVPTDPPMPDAGPQDAPTPGDYGPPPADSCPGGDGYYCGATLGKDPGTLYACAQGMIAVVKACGATCVVHPTGEPDSCPCPSGDGDYCGGPAGLDANTLYHCEGGVYTAQEDCAGGCKVAGPGASDACAACPSGDGSYCGSLVGGDAHTLYDCAGGVLTVNTVCPGACNVAPQGEGDSCAACPSGNGLYCGDSVGGDANVLYSCTDGRLDVAQRCAAGCQPNDPGVPDSCVPDCPNGNGLYCGQSVGGDLSTLYQCTDGRVNAVQSCGAPCEVHDPGVADSCPAPPPSSPSSGCTAAGRAALSWEAGQLAAGHAYSDYCLAFVYQAFRYGAGIVIPELQKPAAADALDQYRAEGKLHAWTGSAPCGAILLWDRNRCNGYYGHIAISNGDGTLSTSGWPGFGGSPRVTYDWMDRMDCSHTPAGWADSP